jgi:undecaprenyl-diphosphatase
MLESIILGIVQGLTEFIPVSSTAHLILFPWFFNWGGQLDTLTFDVALHAGTLLALFLCFWKDWVDLITKDHKKLGFIIMASIPAGITGFLLNDLVEEKLRSPYIISISLVLVGIFMLISEKMVKNRNFDKINLSDAIVIGISQTLALIPGVSRSGITISTGIFLGIDRSDSAKFSFLLSTPIIAGAVLLHTKKIITGNVVYDPQIFIIGFTASAITGFIAIKFLLSFFKKHPMNIFAYYRFILAAVIIIGLWLKG